MKSNKQSKSKIAITMASIAAIAGGVYIYNEKAQQVQPMSTKSAQKLCKEYCDIHEASELRETGLLIDGKPHVECWCKTSFAGWRRNRTNMRLTTPTPDPNQGQGE